VLALRETLATVGDEPMSDGIDLPDYEQKRKETLDRLYALREDLITAAISDTDYAKYAQNGLESLDEAGYDVTLPHRGGADS
jgi:hypothetical protein